jgi:hypothetical protein
VRDFLPYKQHFLVTPTFTLYAVTRLVMQHLQYARVVQHNFFESLRLQAFLLGHCIVSYLLFAKIKAAVSNCVVGPFTSVGRKKHESTNRISADIIIGCNMKESSGFH